ncbi:hypothetical protein BJ684DRAFT_21584 [Piptocephalis cylindrospora]|uniref:Uncharacterized protein n=1 Tax=Piptocephalis cylindrospora TaxID=1907219 RepID=A0A4P9Y1A8_9FUNG|nr:hypothetical protein BJ684DRAFT_21584 [Piptocephalis cylindrospora]|eukprot:RKP11841.1 hypothetical protein BJ684DRAFT_21584 [Piptocephalis cylindrospora]
MGNTTISQDSYVASPSPRHRHAPSMSVSAMMNRSGSQASSQSSFGAEIPNIPIEDTARAYAETTAALDARRTQSADSEREGPLTPTTPPNPSTSERTDSGELAREMARGVLAMPGPQVPPPSISQQRTLRRKPVLPGVVGAGIPPGEEEEEEERERREGYMEEAMAQEGIPPSEPTILTSPMGIVSRSVSSSGMSKSGSSRGVPAPLTIVSPRVPDVPQAPVTTPSLSVFDEASPITLRKEQELEDDMNEQDRPHTASAIYSHFPARPSQQDPYFEERAQSSFPSHIPPWSPLHPRHQRHPSTEHPHGNPSAPEAEGEGLKRRKSKKKKSKEQVGKQESLVAPWTRTLQRRVSAHRLGLTRDSNEVSGSRGGPGGLTRNHTITGRMGHATAESLHGLRPRTSQANMGPSSKDQALLHPPMTSSSSIIPPNNTARSGDPPSPLGYRLVRTMASAGSLASAAAAAEEGRPLPEEERAEAEGSAPNSLFAATEAWKRMAAAEDGRGMNDSSESTITTDPPVTKTPSPAPPPLLLDEAQEQRAQARMALDPADTEPRRLLRANSLARLRRHMAARNEGTEDPRTLDDSSGGLTPSTGGGSAPASTVTTPTECEGPQRQGTLPQGTDGAPRSLGPLVTGIPHSAAAATTTHTLSPQESGAPATLLHRSRSSPAIPDSILLRRTQAISPLLPAEVLQRAASISRSGGSIRRPRGKTFGEVPSSSPSSGPPILSLNFPTQAHGLPSPSPKASPSDTDSILGVPKRPVNEYEQAEAHLVDLKIVVDKKILIKLQIDRDIPLTRLWQVAKDKFCKCGYDSVMTPDKVLVYRDPAGNVVRLDGDFALSIVLTGCPRKMTFFCV